uniref:Uncharacterized protein n=1 Tax=Alexandrium monilatum TaxID=311494 RepID=A0A7S4Q9T0_9DINO
MECAEEGEEETDPEMPVLVPAQAAPVSGPPAPRERSVAELAAMSKFQRRAYHEARQEAHGPQRPQATTCAARRAAQEAQRRAKAGREADACWEPRLAGPLAEVDLLAEMAEAAAADVDAEDSDDSEPVDSAEGTAADLEGFCARALDSMAREGCRGLRGREDLEAELGLHGGAGFGADRLLGAVLRAIAREACAAVDLAAERPQPNTAAALMRPVVRRRVGILEELWATAEPATAATAAVAAAQAGVAAVAATTPEARRLGVECAEVGFLMTLRDEVHGLEDAGLCSACRTIEHPSRVMRGFARFLEEEAEASSEEAEASEEAEGEEA